jgi:methylated-DNA-[protein]-cysteine S-methyltransferase
MNKQLRLFIDRMMTPIGELILLSDEFGSLRAVDWTDYEQRMRRLLARHYRATHVTMEPRRDPFGLTSMLESYFGGDLKCLQSIPVSTGGTVFQQSVWQSLRSIPAGETTSYGNLAKRLGRPAAVRAVGLANGANPVGIVVPCHRVIGADGSLTGYGGGLQRKQWLLDHERKHSNAPDRGSKQKSLSDSTPANLTSLG